MKIKFQPLGVMSLVFGLGCMAVVQAAGDLRVQKHLLDEDLSYTPQQVTFSLYANQQAKTPLAIQTFYPGEWTLQQTDSYSSISATLTNLDSILEKNELWFETELDGVTQGDRQQVRAAATGITFASGNALNMDGNKITNLDGPFDDGDAANKAYVDLVVGSVPDGDVTAVNVTPGSGLTGGGAGGDLSIGVDSNVLQKRVRSGCPRGSSISTITNTGSVICEIDNDTTYHAGSGLNLSGTTFSVDSTIARKDALSGNQDFDRATLYLDYFNDRVGMGDPSPSTRLDVNGDVTADRYAYRNTKTYYQYISTTSFKVVTGEAEFATTVAYIRPLSTSLLNLVSSVHLPDGADMTQLKCYYYDNDSKSDIAYINANLFARSVLSTGASVPASFASVPAAATADTTMKIAEDTTISGGGDPINNSTYSYMLHVTFDLTAASIPSRDTRFYGCQLTYELDEVSQ